MHQKHNTKSRRSSVVVALALIALAIAPALVSPSASAALKQAGSAFVGRGGYSADGLGQFGPGGKLQAEVPSGSTVVTAYLYGTYYFSGPLTPAQRTISFDGANVVMTELTHASQGCCQLRSARAEVTSQVRAKVGTGGSITDYVIGNDPSGLDGVALVVIYSNLTLPETTIAVLDGGAAQSGDTATFDFLTPLNKDLPDFKAIMSLGSGFSFQGGYGPTHACGNSQFSTVDVNGTRLTSCAGHYDDGAAGNGALITVGGVGDSLDNPTNPNSTGVGTDDELYDVEPFVKNGDTQISIRTANPSADDLLFLSVIAVTGRAVVGCKEDGLNALDATPAKGAASKVVHDTVEPLAESLIAGAGMTVHDINCAVVVAVEDTVDGVLAGGVPAVPGAPPVPPTPGLPSLPGTFADGFEAGQGNWTVAGNAGWAFGAPTSGPNAAKEGANVAATVLGGNYVNNANGSLTSPVIDLRSFNPSDMSPTNPNAGKKAIIRFWSWFSSEGFFDCGQIAASADAGAFAKVAPREGYPRIAGTAFCGSGSFSGPDGGVYKQYSLDLTSFAGKQVNLRYAFASDSSVTAPGWYLDDFRLSVE